MYGIISRSVNKTKTREIFEIDLEHTRNQLDDNRVELELELLEQEPESSSSFTILTS